MASPIPETHTAAPGATVLTDSLKVILEQILVELTHLASVVWGLGVMVWVWLFFAILVFQILFDSRDWLWQRAKRTVSSYWKFVVGALVLLVVVAIGRVFVWRAIRAWWATHITEYWTRMQEAALHIFTGAALTPGAATHLPPSAPLVQPATVMAGGIPVQQVPTPLVAT